MIQQELLDEVVAAYALKRFPFPQPRRELDPLRRPDDLTLVAWVDGWQKARAHGDFLAERAANRQPAVVLVVGGSGTGRSSLANTLVRMWVEGHEAQREPVVARKVVEVSDANKELFDLALQLDGRREEVGLQTSDRTAQMVDGYVNKMPEAMGQALNRLLKRLAVEVREEGSTLIGILEGIDKKEFLSLAAQAFSGVDACLVMTIDDTPGNDQEVMSQAPRLIDEDMSRQVRLTELSGSDVCELVQSRWRECSNHPDRSPFSDAGLEAAFNEPRRTLRDVLGLLQALLVSKVDLGRDDRWPDTDRLAFTDEELKQKVMFYDGRMWRR